MNTRAQGCTLVSVGSFSGRVWAQAQVIILGVGWSWLVLADLGWVHLQMCIQRGLTNPSWAWVLCLLHLSLALTELVGTLGYIYSMRLHKSLASDSTSKN